MPTTTDSAPRPHSSRPRAPWRKAAATTAGVLALGGLGALVHHSAASSPRPAVAITPVGSSVSSRAAEASSIWSALLQLDAAEAAAVREGLSPEMRAAVDELDRKLADQEAANRAQPDTLGVTQMYGAFVSPPGSTLDITEMYGAFVSAPLPG
jgi:hypothetical protein